MTQTLSDILEEFRQLNISKRGLGNQFERLIAGYLKTDPLYTVRFSDVWLWSEWPNRPNRGDTGIDLVAKDRFTGELCAIQCKFVDPSHNLQKGEIDSFFTESGKSPFSSRIIFSTTDKWSQHAEEALIDQRIPINRIRFQDLETRPIDWSQFSLKYPEKLRLKSKDKKKLRPHQKEAVEKVKEGFKTADRGKIIMACGTGKTFTALKIAEQFASKNGHVLFLVPSISLLSQTLREWTAEAEIPLHSLIVCSDIKVSRKSGSEDIHLHDLAFPPTTKPRELLKQIKGLGKQSRLTVVFSTYHSIKTVADAQAEGFPEFDLIICDEAHRTTGVTLADEDESHFVQVHNQKFIKAKKRLYMTATPRLYGDAVKVRAKENDAILCSMDDESIYGKEFYRLGFAQSVKNNLLTDYKVIVLAVDEKYISKTFQKQIADLNNEIKLDDAVKIIGCWNGLSKRMIQDEDHIASDHAPMRRAVAFARTIKDSKKIKDLFSQVVEQYCHENSTEEKALACEIDHVDGSFNSLERNKRLDWLKAPISSEENRCRILTNARCLSEGVDVPALDAVMFLNPRDSQVDVVQSVGRVMRKAEGKKYGYIILPIGIPADTSPEDALKNNKKYEVVWQVLQALRAHDDRFNATINQIELNQAPPDQIQIIGVGGSGDQEAEKQNERNKKLVQASLNLTYIQEWKNAIYAKIVLKCGDRRYWESWAKDVAQIAERHVTRIKTLLEGSNSKHRIAFDEFLRGLQNTLNPSIQESDAIEMLSQHLITKPVFDALFEGYQFTKSNPVSTSMQKMLDLLEKQALEKETETLKSFYDSVKDRAQGIDNAEGKQRIIVELYEKFFRTAFPRMADRLGIVYTPVEVVDFIIQSANDALEQEFGVELSDENVDILDPFTGTGTFIVRLLQSGLIQPNDLARKYHHELHANEIVLLAYYIAAINIEAAYHDKTGGEYEPFDGIVLTDTFQMTEDAGTLNEYKSAFQKNNERVLRQNKRDIRVIIGNPPYSVGQTSENDGNKNLKYTQLDKKIANTYAEYSSATNKNSLYDSYIRAIRWASDRLKNKGILCYVTNGSFIDSNAMNGLRKCLADEFTSIYCFNLRGNARTSGEQRRMEKGNVFGEGTRTPIAITLLIKNPEKKGECRLFYHDIGNYLSREEKLKTIANFGTFKNIKWKKLTPNSSHDWINPRDPVFEKFIPLGDKGDEAKQTVFKLYSSGVKTNRDTWAYNFSKKNLTANMSRMIDFYNEQVKEYQKLCNRNSKSQQPDIEKFINNDPKNISWSSELKEELSKFIIHSFKPYEIVQGLYRPFCKQAYYFDRYLNSRVYQIPKIFPNESFGNLFIAVTGMGASKDFSALITNAIPNLHFHDTGQCFPLFYYEKVEEEGDLPGLTASGQFTKKENISQVMLDAFRKTYDSKITREDIFYYVYGILHSPEYKTRFASDLRKMLPRIPFAKDFWAFSKAGKALAQWHLNYETVEPYPLTESTSKTQLAAKDRYRVSKMIFGKREGKEDKTTIIYNHHVTLSSVPLKAYEYVVNGKPAIEWIMERYQYTKDKDSQITNDPNDWSDDPLYIINLLKRIVRVSLETMQIIHALPALNEKEVKIS